MSATSGATERCEAAAGTESLTEVLRHKLLLIVHRACCEIRALSRTSQQERIFDLADAVEFFPEELRNWKPDYSFEAIRGALRTYQGKYPRIGADYLAMLDMDDAEFDRLYIHHEVDMNDPEVRAFVEGPGSRPSKA